jgi:hypothetical protein
MCISPLSLPLFRLCLCSLSVPFCLCPSTSRMSLLIVSSPLSLPLRLFSLALPLCLISIRLFPFSSLRLFLPLCLFPSVCSSLSLSFASRMFLLLCLCFFPLHLPSSFFSLLSGIFPSVSFPSFLLSYVCFSLCLCLSFYSLLSFPSVSPFPFLLCLPSVSFPLFPIFKKLYILTYSYINLLKAPCFSPCRAFLLWNWASSVGGRKCANLRFVSFALSAFAFLPSFFFALSHLFCFALASAKTAQAPTSVETLLFHGELKRILLFTYFCVK